MDSNENVIILLAGRAAVYRTLQNVLGNEPDAAMLNGLVSSNTKEVLGLFSQFSENYKNALELLQSCVVEGLNNETAFVDSLSDSFTRLFVGPGKVEAEPWESIYISKEGVLFQQTTLEVRKAYVASGLIPSAYPHVADDHIGIELDFMAMLAQRLAAAFEAGQRDVVSSTLKASSDFLDNHLLTWLPAFSRTLNKARHGHFYREAARLLVSFTALDKEVLEEIATLI